MRTRIKMYSSWVLALLLGLGVAAGPLVSLSTGCRNKSLNLERVKAGSIVLVPCNNTHADEVSFKLFHNKDIISTGNASAREGVKLELDKPNQKAYYQLSNVQANWTGLYRCEAEVLYPPPYKKLPDVETVLVVEEEQCVTQTRIQCPPVSDTFPIWWVMACGVLTVFSLVMTGIAAVLWVSMFRRSPPNLSWHWNSLFNLKSLENEQF
uniref:Uncharacterized LOC108920653 n=1 Tax=Scleropages formosus TaxID=113540 RepID=A0A8C9S2I3_SCLFO